MTSHIQHDKSQLDRVQAILADLIGFASVSHDSNLDIISYIADHLQDCGAEVKISKDATGQKANVFATLGPKIDGGIVLSGHTDVVPAKEQGWLSDPFVMQERDNRLYGRGTCDMKGFIACALVMAPVYAQGRLKRPVHFAFTYDEETGCLGAAQLVKELQEAGIKPAIAIVGEPTMMGLIEGHKGCCEYSTHFHGLEGHGSQPDAGVSAIEYATRYISRLLDLRQDLKARTPKDSRFQPPWTTMHVGMIAGGVAHNVIAGHCQVDWEMRPVVQEDKAFVLETMKDFCERDLLPAMQAVYPEAAIKTQVVGDVIGLEPVDDNQACAIIQELTGANSVDLVAFGTEAGLFQSIGMHAVICGPGSIEQAHKANEFVSLEQLELCRQMLAKLDVKLR